MRLVAASAIIAMTQLSTPVEAAQPINCERLLNAIKAVENWDGHTPGRAGEWGCWQMLPSVWKTYTDVPQRLSNLRQQHDIAGIHLTVIIRSLTEHSVPLTARNVGLAWTAGITATITGRAKPNKRAYADRVANIYNQHP